jgi:aryl-alcohol dehydrogenase-like predicted oxidoreductase
MASTTTTRRIGDVDLFPIGLGEMPLSIEGRPGEDAAIRTVHAALDAGVTLIDTADAYCLGHDDFGHGEVLVRKALDAWSGDRDSVLVATKGGHTRPEDDSWQLDGSAGYLRSAAEASLRRLGGEAIGLWQFHRPDPSVPYQEALGVLRDLLDEGKVRLAGISNADPAQIRQAQEVLGGRLAAVQNEFSPRFRSSEPELRLCAEQGIAFLPWSPLGGIPKAAGLGEQHGAFADIAQERGVSPQRVCLAWELAKADVVIPIPGSSRPETIRDSAAAAELRLTPDELERLDAAA